MSALCGAALGSDLERPLPNGGLHWEPAFRHDAHFIPSYAVRHVMRSAAIAPVDKLMVTIRGWFL